MNRRTTRAIAGGLLGLAIVGFAVGAAVVPWSTLTASGVAGSDAQAPRVEVTPAPAEAVLACDGPLLALGRDASDAQGLSNAADLAMTMRNSRDEEPEAEAALELPGVASSLEVSQLPDGDEIISVAAAGSATVDAPDMHGYAASACRAPAPETWIVGATVATGVTDLLVVANPSDVPSTVSLEVYGVEGRTVPPNGLVALPAHTQRAIPVASVAGGEQSPVIRVTAEGAPVRTTLQSSRIDTLEPIGIDLQAGVLPSNRHVIPRVRITEAAVESEEPTELRVLGTNGQEGTVDVRVIDEGTGEEAFSTTAELASDEPVSISLDDLDAGSYAVRLSGDVPSVAALRQVAASDYAWVTPSERLDGSSLVAVPESRFDEFALTFAALGGDAASVSIEPVGDGDAQTLDVAAGGSASVNVPAEATYRIVVESGSVAGAAGTWANDAVGAFPIDPDPSAPEGITVVP
ncbi:DUF5719 family protein [Microbacterium sp. G2-8]|uniref:DUF5719 family protein n=1 Tax=Microbacterium sp. G2-8 TaxID=2842454 RepID=UPI001C896455|nr:DUF5719 family protein [Microbacterium sp. G2-8]